MHSISPNTGSMEGGTLLTITGEYFGKRTKYTWVKVAGTPCKIVDVQPNQIKCVTGKPNPESLKGNTFAGIFLLIFKEDYCLMFELNLCGSNKILF